MYLFIFLILSAGKKTIIIIMPSSFSPTFNAVEDENAVGHPVTPTPRKKRKKFIDTTKKLSQTNSMYGAICKRGFALLFCEAGNPATAKNYQNPGSRKKVWSLQFDKGKSSVFIVYK